jgi:tetratricopeptide (TPR) repeat protein
MDRAIRLGQKGKTAEALAANTEALDIARRLARADPLHPTMHEPVIASLLYNMAALLANSGRIEEAVQASAESADLYGQVAATDPRLLPEYGDALARHGRYLNGAGRPREAVRESEKAVDVYERLSGIDAEQLESGLARALVSLAAALRGSGQVTEAFGPAWQAVHLYEELPERPDQLSFRADAAHELAIALGHRGRWAEALPLDAQAVSGYRRLAARGFEGLDVQLTDAEAALLVHVHAAGEPGTRFVRELAAGDERLHAELYELGEAMRADQRTYVVLSSRFGGLPVGPAEPDG